MEELERQLSARGLSIAYVPEKGRCLVAAKDFSPGAYFFRWIWRAWGFMLQAERSILNSCPEILDNCSLDRKHEFQMDYLLQSLAVSRDLCWEPYASMPNTSSSDQRCSRCFASGNLKKCSACRMVWYCGSECQALVELGEDRQKMLTPSICLMVRLILKRKLQSEQRFFSILKAVPLNGTLLLRQVIAIPATAMDNYNLVEALTDLLVDFDYSQDMSDIGEERLLLYAQMANLVNLILPSLKINIKEVARNFSKLSISYIETAASTTTRQKALKEQYLFSCTCSRCTKEDQYEDIQEGAILEGYRCKDITCDGFLLLDSDKKVFLCQRCGLSRTRNEIKSIAKEIEQISEKASRSLNIYNELTGICISGTEVDLLLLLANKVSNSHAQHCKNSALLFIGIVLNLAIDVVCWQIFMERQDWKGALVYCRLTLPVYEGVYPPIHPVVGLQYYTCGKLEWLLEETGEAIKSLTKAADILQITHGTSSPFVKELFAKLEEAHAEAAYSLKQHD
ncbi:hypothetical protein ACLOJK_016670 [Asimina triloba]